MTDAPNAEMLRLMLHHYSSLAPKDLLDPPAEGNNFADLQPYDLAEFEGGQRYMYWKLARDRTGRVTPVFTDEVPQPRMRFFYWGSPPTAAIRVFQDVSYEVAHLAAAEWKKVGKMDPQEFNRKLQEVRAALGNR